jgi:putative ABC transport system substrate-binding protein
LREDQFAHHASELVKLKVDLILCAGDAAIRAAQQATKTIPILGGAENMVAAGLVRSLANPGSNTTGFSALASDLDGKRLELPSELAPGAHKVAALTDPNSVATPQHLAMLEQAARTRGVELSMLQAKRADEITSLIEQAKTSGVAGLNILSSPLLYVNRQVVLTSVERVRLPAIYPWPEASEEGGLIAYGVRILQMYRDILARQAVKLLRGTKPSELPVEQPTKFELVINLKTANAMGVTVPPALLARADKVIE